MTPDRGLSKTHRLHGPIREPRARHFIEHEHRWADGRRHVCAYDRPLPPRFNPKSVLLRWKLFVQPGTWDGKCFGAGTIARTTFPLEGIVVSKIITRPGTEPRVSYGYEVSAHMFSLFEQGIDATIRTDLRAEFGRRQAIGQSSPQRETTHSGSITGEQVLHDMPVGEFQDPQLLAFIKRRVDARVRKRFAGLREEEFDQDMEKWPGRCFHMRGSFYDERLGELRLLPFHGGERTLGERGARLTVEVAHEFHSKSRQPPLGQLYEELHRESVREERTVHRAGLILSALWSAVPDLRRAIKASPKLSQRLLHAIEQSGSVGFDGAFFLARHLAAIAIGSPADDERTVRAREELIRRRMECRDGHIRLILHAPRRLS
jgi:hypothetical protein